MPVGELRDMFQSAGLNDPRIAAYRLEGELEDLLARSFPSERDAVRIREMFERSLAGDALDMATRREDGKIYYGFPVAILASI
jgi:hypothetical protein